MHTENYIRLQRRAEKLRRVYLPSAFSPTGSYSDNVYEKVRAYKVLVHAEMEYYFEEIALLIAKKAYQKWQEKRKASTPLLAMVAYYSGNYSAAPDSHDGNRSDENIDWRINKAFADYNALVRTNNHGIKERNILSIFLPIGIQISDIDENMLIELNNFGAERGNIAHSTRVGAIVTPEDAFSSVSSLMAHISAFDEFLKKYRNSV